MTYLIIDTNVCLHFISMDEYPWHSHKECDSDITVVITHVLIEELDKKKYGGKDHLKQRAIKTLKLIEESINSNLKNGCSLIIFNENVNRDYMESLGLDVLDSDDKILAIINKFKKNPNVENIYLVTNDLGPRLKAKKFNINCIIPFEKYQLKSPEDELEKSIKLLKVENEKLKNLVPKLSVVFENGDITVKYKVLRSTLTRKNL